MNSARSYLEAKRLGLPRYFTGAPCKHGHVAERTVKRRTCLECVRLKGKNADADHRAQQRQANARSYAKYRQKRTSYNKAQSRTIRTGFSSELFEQRLVEQDYKCAICRTPLRSDRQTHADHCHKTLQCRSILCCGCNTGLGCLKDSPELLRAAALYIEYWREKSNEANDNAR